MRGFEGDNDEEQNVFVKYVRLQYFGQLGVVSKLFFSVWQEGDAEI